jgi:hypothetical protein
VEAMRKRNLMVAEEVEGVVEEEEDRKREGEKGSC